METIRLEKERKIFYIIADSFPEGVQEAWKKLHSLLPSVHGRNFYGISHGNPGGGITYKAAVEEIADREGKQYGCETYTIPKGEYLAVPVFDFMNCLPEIGKIFQELINHPDFDGITPCIEWYKNDNEVICMVKRMETNKAT